MKLLETKHIKIADKDYPLILSLSAMMGYETVSGHQINDATETIKDRTIIFHQCMIAGGYKGTYEEFIILIDYEPSKVGEFLKIMFESVEKK